jgi:dCMP deaminase
MKLSSQPRTVLNFSVNYKTLRYDLAHMESAFAYAKLSFSRRTQVGAVLVDENNRAVCCGFNGRPSGHNNNCERELPCDSCIGLGCEVCNGTGTVLETLLSVIHAEKSCLDYAKELGIDTSKCTLYVTHSPCEFCADTIIESKVPVVVYSVPYRITTGVQKLVQAGVLVRKL